MALTDLAELLSNLSVRLDPERYVWASVSVVPEGRSPVVTVEESEGVTVVLREDDARALDLPHEFPSARITLEVHSSLEAVGLTAVFARVLADEGISANVVAGFHHDHVFVPWGRRAAALAALERLEAASRGS
ncbi:ACT domain-containing protein [Demequina sp. SYSU T00192]|uniref:ACT domain-containing protein n=1 Tax=Demequina litoralis TaxID=3051660 RepID=A0ABT8GAU0_9MICO|nr:ACT domain-containing protein [Demequina sp. SYSU T00192]MDN4476250.1 ACT domain-containing protein [Demequina sp. SYSU T00192]